MKTKIIQTLGLAVLALGICRAPGQVLMTTVTNTTYTYNQNFDSLPTQSGTTLTTNVWLNNSTLLGWYCNASNAAAPAVFGSAGSCTNIVGASGTSTLGAFFSYGTNGVNALSDRAIGSIMANSYAASGSPGMAYGIRFTNDTGIAMTNFTITYTGEEWRLNNTVPQQLTFGYRVDSSPITNTDVGSANTWNAVGALNFISPISTGTAGSLDGNAPANRTTMTAVLPGVVVLPGQEIFLRWLDVNDSGNDHGLAIDDVKVVFTNTIASAVAPSFTANTVNTTLQEGSSLIGTVAVNGTQPISFYWYNIESGPTTNFVGTANPQLIYTYLTTSQTGNKFFVVASNSVGTATSFVATLTVTSSVAIPATIATLRALRHPTTYAVTDQTNLYRIDGIVTTPNLLTGPLQSYFVQDATGGIDVFNRDGNFALPAVGDRVQITGPLFNFNGLLELNITNANPSHHLVNLSSGNALPATNLFVFSTASNPTTMENSIEGTLVMVTNVFLTYTNSAFFAAGGTIFMTNATGKRFDLSIPSDSIGNMVNKQLQSPPFAQSIVGVISQNTTSVPTNGYSLVVFAYDNIHWTNNVSINTPLTVTGGGTNQVITWPLGAMSLSSSTNVAGPYVIIPGASSPYTNDATTNAANFFRLIYP